MINESSLLQSNCPKLYVSISNCKLCFWIKWHWTTGNNVMELCYLVQNNTIIQTVIFNLNCQENRWRNLWTKVSCVQFYGQFENIVSSIHYAYWIMTRPLPPLLSTCSESARGFMLHGTVTRCLDCVNYHHHVGFITPSNH